MSPEQMLSKLAVEDILTISCDSTVQDAVSVLDEKQIRSAPVVDDKGVFKGMFSVHELIKSLVPFYIDDMGTLDFAQGASPVLASRLKRMFPSRVGDHVSADDCAKITSVTHTWEALRMLTKYGSAIPIVDEKTGVLKGLISDQSAMHALLEMEEEEK